MENLISKMKQIKEAVSLLKSLHTVYKQDGMVNESSAASSMAQDAPVTSDVNSTMKFDQENMDMNKKEKIVDALDKAGQRESALKLKNWGEMDSIAKAMEEEIEKSYRRYEGRVRHLDTKVNGLQSKYEDADQDVKIQHRKDATKRYNEKVDKELRAEHNKKYTSSKFDTPKEIGRNMPKEKEIPAINAKLEKSVKADVYDPKLHDYPTYRPDMENHEKNHAKAYHQANQGDPVSGKHSSGEHESHNYGLSEHHFLKTGRALKFPKIDPANTAERKHFNLEKPATPKGKLP